MTNAKALINLTEGTIQLEGPVTFVREYLEKYSPAMNVQITHKVKVKTPRVKVARVKSARVKTARPKTFQVKVAKAKIIKEKPPKQKKIKPLIILTRGKRGRNSLARIVNAEIESGFFNNPISIKEVDNRLKEKGVSGSRAMIKSALKRAIAEGKIEIMGKGRGVVYMRKNV
jgi:hypothetical protein